jgi:hypothetical protein
VARKTVPVEDVKRNANRMLRNSDETVKDGRIGVYMLLERVLFDTGNYKGYKYISPNDDASNIAGELDDTRRFYY